MKGLLNAVSLILLVAMLFAALEGAAQTDIQPGDSSAALAFTQKPLVSWWQGLSEAGRKAFLAGHAALASSFEFHSQILGAKAANPGTVADYSLSDWWEGLSEARRQKVLREQPKLSAAFAQWRKQIDAWSAAERRPARRAGH